MVNYLVSYMRTRDSGYIPGVRPLPNTYIYSVTIDHTKCGTADSTDFPILFAGTYDGTDGEPDLRTVVNGGAVENANGYDICFYSDADCTTLLDFERVSWSATTGVVEFWIRIPTLTYETDTIIYLKYGVTSITTDQQNITGVWTKYLGVWHFNSNLTDSTASPVTMTDSDSDDVAGTIGNARSFGTLGDYFKATVGTGNKLDMGGKSLTIESWVDQTSANSYGHIILHPLSDTTWNPAYYSYGWERNAGNSTLWFVTSSGGVVQQYSTTTNVLDGTNRHLTSTYDGSYKRWYVNGVENGVGVAYTSTLTTANTNLYWGRENLTGTYKWAGILDECRIGTDASLYSTSWITSNYNTQSSPSTFYTLTFI